MKDEPKVEPKMSQTQMVMSHLVKRGSITSWQAIEEYRITRLSAVIHSLRNSHGMNIQSTLITNGRKKYTIYTLARG